MFYRHVIAQIERRRIELNWSCERLDNAAGLAAGHFAKLKNADARSGRCARWETLDLLVEALWPNEDFELLVLSTSSIAEAASSKRGLFA
jgi:hypothetical protein